MPPQPRPYLYWIIISLLVVYAATITFFATKGFLGNTESVSTPQADDIFKLQTAIIEGKINSVSGNKLSVTNRQGLKAVVEASENISTADFNNPLASPSTDLKKLQTGKDATINLTLFDGVYKVTGITYQTFIPTLPLNLPSSQPQQTESQSPGQAPPSPIVSLPSILPITPPKPASVSALPTPPSTP